MRTVAYVMEADVHQGRPEVAAQFPVEDEPGALSVVETETSAAPDADAAGRFETICEALRTRGCMLERARYAIEAKPLYETVHPETRQGGRPGKAGGGKAKPSTVDPFVRYMAKRTQVSATTIKNAVSIGRGLAPTVIEQLWGSKLANATTDLLRLAGVSEAAQKVAVAAFHKPRGGILALRATLDELAPRTHDEPASRGSRTSRNLPGIIIDHDHVIHPWVGRIELEPWRDDDDDEPLLPRWGLPPDAMWMRLAEGIASGALAYGPYMYCCDWRLFSRLRRAEQAPGDPHLRMREIADLHEHECVLVESEGPEQVVSRRGKEKRLRNWVLSIGWSRKGALPERVLTVIGDVDGGLFVHAPSSTPVAVWGL